LVYTYGHGVHKDHKQVIKWCRKAAEQGYVSAQFDLFVFEGLFTAVEDAGEVTITTRNIEGQIQERHFNRKKEKDESFILVETHSEHLILRLLKRLREGIIKPEDLAIHYFE
jgi:TPR repeat protein